MLLLIVGCSTNKAPRTNAETIVNLPSIGKPFTYKSSLNWVKDLSEKANCTVNLESFQKELISIEKFDYSDDNGSQVLSKLLGSSKTIRTYKTKNPFTKVIATTYGSDKESMYFNLRKNPRKPELMINTACHEKLHLDGYSHGDNNRAGKENSVNYFVGTLCQKYSKECLSE